MSAHGMSEAGGLGHNRHEAAWCADGTHDDETDDQ